jgi:hypothetical protein
MVQIRFEIPVILILQFSIAMIMAFLLIAGLYQRLCKSMLFLALIDRLHEKGSLKFCNPSFQRPLVIGVQNSQWAKRDVITTDYRDTIVLAGHHKAWYGADNKEKYWMLEIWDAAKLNIPNYIYSEYIVSQDLKDLVKNKFKSDEEKRFTKQQLATWISIAVAIILGILGLIF